MNRRMFLKTTAAASTSMALTGSAQAAPAESKPIKVLLWCWDSRMTWDDEPENIQLKMAAAEKLFPYPKRPESYLTGFRRMVDYCADAGIWGVIIWGFLRDSHGGVEAAKDLCKYASDRGVAILPGVGLCSYGGYYYEGEHPYSLGSYLKAHPERASTAWEDGGGKREVHPVLDPSLEANQTWWREGLEWMLDTFEIGGINYEMGDFIVNPSPRAVAAREALGFSTNGNILDMVVATKGLMDRAYEIKPEGTFINALYRGYHQIDGFPEIPYGKAMNPKTVWEYTLLRMVRQKDFPEAYLDVPPHRQYGYLHWFNPSTKTMEKDYTEPIAELFPALKRVGFEFVGTYGEVGVKGSTVADANYRAQVAHA